MNGNPLKLIRVGVISSVDAASGTARIKWNDEDNKVSADLPVCQARNFGSCKLYRMFEPGEQVIAVFPSNSYSDGYILAAVPSNEDLPLFNSTDKMGLQFGGINITLSKDGSIDINTPGRVKINGKEVETK